MIDLDASQLLQGGLENPHLRKLITGTLSNLFDGRTDLNDITGEPSELDLELQEAIKNVLTVLGRPQLLQSFLRASSGSGPRGGSHVISTLLSGKLRTLGLMNVEATLKGLLFLEDIGNGLLECGKI